MKQREPDTTVVMQVLLEMDDLLTAEEIAKLSGLSRQEVRAALNNLMVYKAVGVEIDPRNIGYWYATPESDQRTRVFHTRKVYERPRSDTGKTRGPNAPHRKKILSGPNTAAHKKPKV